MISSRMLSHDSRSNRQTPNNILSNQITPSRTHSRSSSHISNDYTPSRTYNLRSSSYISNDYIPSNRSTETLE
ncbi:1510_t:CDS:2 [Funneliformis caledonium]|uniref:1510_t:CDS:1 n=1 Tax=Funneliformis caledonium TaxID=1117310 RepID=A0A9N8WFH4_9GLOM|nr:1510_t:CDS:2 [Funneliformis caledonium]